MKFRQRLHYADKLWNPCSFIVKFRKMGSFTTVLCVCVLLIIFNASAYRRRRRFRIGPSSHGMENFRSGRRVAELTVDQDNLRALCESKVTPGASTRRMMETTFGGKGAAFLEAEGIDRKLLCQSKIYEKIKRDGMQAQHETVGTSMVMNEDNIGRLLDESNKGPSSDRAQEFSVEVDSSVTGNGKKDGSVGVRGSAEGLSGTGFKSKTRTSTILQKPKKKNLMEMDHFKETDFEVDLH